MSDLYQKITGSRGLLENIASKIPGFSGYMDRETRRDADKILRNTIVTRYAEQLKRMADLQIQLVNSGEIELLDDIQTAITRLQTFVDMVRTASYGYSGFFDAVKGNEAELAKLYAFDNALLENAEKVSAAVDTAETSLGGDGLPAAIRNLISIATEAKTTFERRKEVLLS